MVVFLIALIGAAAFFWSRPQPVMVSVVTVERGEVRSRLRIPVQVPSMPVDVPVWHRARAARCQSCWSKKVTR